MSDYGDCYIGSGDDNEEEENDDDVRRGRLAVHGTLTWQLFYLEGAVVSHSRALGDRPTVYNPRRPESKGANSYNKQETNLRKKDPPTPHMLLGSSSPLASRGTCTTSKEGNPALMHTELKDKGI